MTSKFIARISKALQKNNPESPVGSLGLNSIINGRYCIDAELGRGGMGIVYRTYDLTNKRDVAIKIVNPETANALTLPQFEREVEITSRLKHPNIVSVFETGTANIGSNTPLPYIVMELVQGTKLTEYHNLTHARIIDIAKQICDALQYIHEAGIVYRDLKPGNIIVEKHGFRYFIKLLDFGLARPRGMENLPNESNIAGTIFYLAPELIAGQPADIASDLYALGAVMYEMLTGRVPFSDFDEQTVIAQHLEESVSPPSHSRSDTPPELDVIVLRLLAKKPEDRFASAKEVQQALEAIPLISSINKKGNLPPKIEMAGHETEIANIQQMLISNRLVTILGSDNNLALAVGSQLTSQFADGVWQMDLNALENLSLLPKTAASFFGISEDAQRPIMVTLIEALREKNLLLLMLRCDHVVSACAQFSETILGACPEVQILATSLTPLKINIEACYTT